MKHNKIIPLIGACTALTFALPMSAQDNAQQSRQQQNQQHQNRQTDQQARQPIDQRYGQQQDRQRMDAQNQQQRGTQANQMRDQNRYGTHSSGEKAVSVSDFVGADLIGSEGSKIGSIEEVYIDVQSGEVLGVVISSGGVLGFGDNKYAVHVSELNYNAEEEEVRINKTSATLRNAPVYTDNDTSVFDNLRREWNNTNRGMQNNQGVRGTGTGSDRMNEMDRERDRDRDVRTPGR